jgi:uncharacterized protein (DUF1330 family)
MSIYAIFTYNVTNPELYSKYMPGSAPVILGTISKHGGTVIFADSEANYIDGEAKIMNVCIKFPSEDAFHAWENDPEYAEAKGYRLGASDNYTIFLAKEFTLPG